MTKIYLIRHAEAEGNVYRRLQGQYDSMITPNGFAQIRALAKRFADIPVDAVYASDLTRTCLTARAICDPKHLPLHTDCRLREMKVGIWENLPFGYLSHIEPEKNRDFSRRPDVWQVEGSERLTEYTGRFLTALEEIARKYDGQTVAVFSHGMVLRGALQTLFYPNDRNAVEHCENTAVSCIHYENGAYSLQMLNDASHISPEISTLGRQMWWRGDETKDFNLWYRDATPEDAAFTEDLGFTSENCRKVRIVMRSNTRIGVVAVQNDELVFLGLLAEHRGIGLGAQLLGEAVSMARDGGFTVLHLCNPTSTKLFERYGFVDGKLSLVPDRTVPIDFSR